MPDVPTEDIPRISGIILAAGESSRLGQPKQLLELDGKILLQHVVDSATRAGLHEIVVVLGHDAESVEAALLLPINARVVVNPEYRSGQSTSLRAGLDAVDPRADAAAILLGDQPRLSAGTIRRTIAAFRASSAPVMRCTWRGEPRHPVLVARPVWDRLARLSGDKGARDLIASLTEVEELEHTGTRDDEMVDVDTWQQYIALGGEPVGVPNDTNNLD